MTGIVKGLAEGNTATRHFGSLLSFSAHMHNAKAAGLVAEDGRTLTELGRRYYETAGLKDLLDTRAYFWTGFDWNALFEAAQAHVAVGVHGQLPAAAKGRAEA